MLTCHLKSAAAITPRITTLLFTMLIKPKNFLLHG